MPIKQGKWLGTFFETAFLALCAVKYSIKWPFWHHTGYIYIYIYISLSLSLCLCFSISFSVSLSVSLYSSPSQTSLFLLFSLSIYVCVYIYISLSLSVSLILTKASTWQTFNLHISEAVVGETRRVRLNISITASAATTRLHVWNVWNNQEPLRPFLNHNNGLFLWLYYPATDTEAPPTNPTDPRPSNHAPPRSHIWAEFRSFLEVSDRFQPILVQNGQNWLEIGSSKRGCSMCLAVRGRGSRQVTRPFPKDFQEENGPSRHSGERPIKRGKRRRGNGLLRLMGRFRTPRQWAAMVENGPSGKAH